ncbi:membrane protein [Opitutaceae bacterium TAV5]|nr:membrane protein [Opitutaceae bacterium TAV5]
MHFLNTALLAALVPLLALPVLIHFLNKRFPQRFLFPTLEHLRKTAAERSRIHRWRHRLLTLVRTLFLLLLLAAFLKPVLDRFGGGAGADAGDSRRVLILVDHSLSMEHSRAGATARQRAAIEAGKIISTLGPDDELNVIAVGQAPAMCFSVFSRNHPDALRFLNALPPGYTRADFTAANLLAARLVDTSPATAAPPSPSAASARAEIYYLSDFRRRDWAQVDFLPLAGRARLYFTDVGAPDAANRAILDVSLPQVRALAGDIVPLEITVGNFSDAPLRDTLTIRIDNNQLLQHEVEAAPWSSARVSVPVPATSPGLHLCEVSLPPDALAADDRHVVTLSVLEKEEILTLSANADPAADPVRFLHAALNPWPGQAGSLLPRHHDTFSLDAAALAGARKIFITRAGPLSDTAAAALAKLLFHGSGIVWFLDADSDADNLARLGQHLDGVTLPITLGPLRKLESIGEDAQQVATGDFKSPFLHLFRGTLRQDLALLEFYDFHTASATGSGRILLRFADETPAMASLEYGLGTLVLMNFSVSEFSGNLARQRIFPAWVQDLVRQLDTAEPPPLSFTAGQPVQGEIWRADLRAGPVKDPSGRTVEVRQEPLGERSAITFTATEPGFYTLAAAGSTRLRTAFAVNPDTAESDLRPVDKAHLPAQLAEGQQAALIEGQSDYDEVARGRPVWQWFLLTALAFLVIEMALQLFVARRPAR